MTSDFLDSHRRAEALADNLDDQTKTQECSHRTCVYEVGGRWSCEYPPVLADGTGRHSRKEMRKATGLAMPSTIPLAMDQELERQMMPPDAEPTGEHLPQCLFGYSGWWCREDCPARAVTSPSVIAGVSFTSVPQLCAAYEYALEMLRQLYAITDLKQHAFQPEQSVMREVRTLLLAAGKEVV